VDKITDYTVSHSNLPKSTVLGIGNHFNNHKKEKIPASMEDNRYG